MDGGTTGGVIGGWLVGWTDNGTGFLNQNEPQRVLTKSEHFDGQNDFHEDGTTLRDGE